MTAHREGAVAVVQTELAQGREQLALEVAQDTGATQAGEVRRVRQLLERLG